MLQYIIVFIIIAAALIYVVYRLVSTLSNTGNGSLCDGCQGCQLKDIKHRCRSQKEVEMRMMKKKNGKNLVE